MKNYTSRKFVLAAITALALVASALQAQAQNALVTFDLTQLQNNVASTTITGSDGITTMTISTTDDWGGNTGAIFVDGTNGLMTGRDSTSVGALRLSFNRDVNFEAFNINTAIPDFGNGIARFQFNDLNLQIPSQAMLYRDVSTGSNDFTAGIKALDITKDSIWFLNGTLSNTNAVPVFWNSLSVTAVPEPASYALLLGELW